MTPPELPPRKPITRPKAPEQESSRFAPGSEAPIPIAREGTKGTNIPWPGRVIGPYVVERALARGGMGLVLLAHDEALRRPVAIKVMGADLVADHDALKRFEREARATATVQHPNIAQIYLVGLSEDGMPFMAMEYVDGGSLRDVIRSRRRSPLSTVAAWMEQVAEGLRAAQRANVIHRDVKPGNIMLTAGGTAKIVDFGLAKIFFEDSYRTQEGAVLGTPSYMAPEQSQGRAVDHRADIYAFGATFYHMLTGRPPFEAETPVQIMMKHVTAPLVPAKTIDSSIPVEFDEIIGRCMRKDFDERYQDYESLLFDIKALRLMMTAREKGSVVDGEDAPSPSPLPVPPSSILRQPPPVAGRQPDVAAAPSVMDRDSSSLGPIPMLLGIGAGVILLIGVVAMIANSRGGGQEAATARPALSVWLERAAEQARLREMPNDDEFEFDYLAYLATMESLRNLHTALVNHELEQGEFPAGIGEIAREDRVLITFDVNEDGAPLDGWGTAIRYDRRNHELRSAGMDRTFHSPTDLVMAVDGTPHIPAVYTRMEGGEE